MGILHGMGHLHRLTAASPLRGANPFYKAQEKGRGQNCSMMISVDRKMDSLVTGYYLIRVMCRMNSIDSGIKEKWCC